MDAMEELVAQIPDSVNVRNAAGNTPSDVAGCEAARDMVKPFKKAVNAVRAAIRFGGLGKFSPGGGGGGGLFRGKNLSAKFVRSPTATPGAAAATIATPDVGKINLGAMGMGNAMAGGGDVTPNKSTTTDSSVPVA